MKLSIRMVGGSSDKHSEDTGGPSQEWLDANLGTPRVNRAINSAFAMYRIGLGNAIQKQYLSSAPGGNGADEGRSKSYLVGKGKYKRAMKLPYGDEQGYEATTAGGAVTNGIMSGDLLESLGKVKIIFSAGAYKLIWGNDLNNNRLDWYLHKTLRKHKNFPKLFMPLDWQRGGKIYNSAYAKAHAALLRLESKDKNKK